MYCLAVIRQNIEKFRHYQFFLAWPSLVGTYVMKVYEGHWSLEEVSRDQNSVPRNYSKLEYT